VPVVRFDSVVKEYSSEGVAVRALDDVSLSVEPGEFVSLVGRSGCGKTTLLNLAGAMDFPTSGSVFVDGQATSGLADAQLTIIRREKVGFVFQFFQLLPTITAAENVEMPLQLAGQANVRRTALERLRLDEMDSFSGRYPHQISGGQLQRVAIARAIVHSPRILLAV
jgi:putative ABC transport system ATP-binding protein